MDISRMAGEIDELEVPAHGMKEERVFALGVTQKPKNLPRVLKIMESPAHQIMVPVASPAPGSQQYFSVMVTREPAMVGLNLETIPPVKPEERVFPAYDEWSMLLLDPRLILKLPAFLQPPLEERRRREQVLMKGNAEDLALLPGNIDAYTTGHQKHHAELAESVTTHKARLDARDAWWEGQWAVFRMLHRRIRAARSMVKQWALSGPIARLDRIVTDRREAIASHAFMRDVLDCVERHVGPSPGDNGKYRDALDSCAQHAGSAVAAVDRVIAQINASLNISEDARNILRRG